CVNYYPFRAAPNSSRDRCPGEKGHLNRLHWVRDVTYDEDHHRARTGNAPQVMASLRNLAISILPLSGTTNIAQAPRHHARRPERPLTTIMNPNC
ncbi:hypothetical protein MXD61_04625, partial [Frankia sp. AgPm24]|nr:hypothetical protein [Frankia sp. AgPm24]